jgi:Ribonuclease G/E
VTTRLLFKSRFAIVTPGAPGRNISRRIRDEALRALLDRLAAKGMAAADEGLGLILRSACAEAEPEAVAEDIAAMRGLAEAVTADLSGGPELLLDGPGAHDLAWRDWLDPAPDEVVTADGCFATQGVTEALDALVQPRVDLPGGGSMWIEETRALVAVDVNTGADTSPAAALKVNVAAARDLPRQLRLRGLGGQVVVDFAPIPKKERHILDQVIRAAFKSEGETNLAGWTHLGLYELTRRRDRLPLSVLIGEVLQ